jgi:hypothetical protein
LGLALLVSTGSIVVLGRSLSTPQPEVEAQELEGRTPQRDRMAAVDLSPDWTHTRGLDRERPEQHRKVRRSVSKVRHASVRIGGGPPRAGKTRTIIVTAPASTSSREQRPHSKGASGKKGGGKDRKEEAEPELPKPAVPLYHLYRTFKKKKPNHYFTGDATAKDEKIEEGWQFLATEGFMFDRSYVGTVAVPADNGIPGYIYEKKEPGSLPLYMLRGYNGYGDIFTSDAAYKDKMIEEGWNDFGIVGYIAQT